MERLSRIAFRLLPIALSVACATKTRPVHVEPPSPPIADAAAATVQRPDSAVGRIEPDRPDVTNGPHVVDVGLLQVEAGVQHARMRTSERNFGTPLTLRMGVFSWLEARVNTDGFVHHTDASSSVSGAGNVRVGAKIRLFADSGGGGVLSILPTINLPVASASKGLSSGDTDSTIALLTGTDLGRTSHLDFNYGIGAIGAGEGRPHFPQHLLSLSVSHNVTEHLNPYIEGFWFSRQHPDGGPAFSIDAGFIQTFTGRLAVDGGVSVGLSRAAPDLSIFSGVSVVVGNVLGDHGVVAPQRKAARLQRRPRR